MGTRASAQFKQRSQLDIRFIADLLATPERNDRTRDPKALGFEPGRTETNWRNEFSAHNCLWEKVIRRCISHCHRHPPIARFALEDLAQLFVIIYLAIGIYGLNEIRF